MFKTWEFDLMGPWTSTVHTTRQTFPKPSPAVIQELGQDGHKARPGSAGSQQVLVAVHQRWHRVRTDVGHPLRLQHACGCCRVLLPTHHNGPYVREFEVTAGKIVGVAERAVLEEAVQVLARAQAAGAGVQCQQANSLVVCILKQKSVGPCSCSLCPERQTVGPCRCSLHPEREISWTT